MLDAPSNSSDPREDPKGSGVAAPLAPETPSEAWPPGSIRRADLTGDLQAIDLIAKDEKLVNFRYLVQVSLWSRCGDEDNIRRRAGHLLPKLVTSFSRQSRGIEKMCFYEHIAAGIVLTNVRHAARTHRPAIQVEAVGSDRRDPRARGIVIKALDLHQRALQNLPQSSRRILVLRVHSLLEALLSQLEGAAVSREKLTDADYASLEDELAKAEATYQTSIQRGAQLTYFIGTLSALVPFAVIAILLTSGLGFAALSEDELLLSASAIAGAAGAVVSVMNRLTGGSFKLEGLDSASRTNLMVFGAIRTVLGAAFGALVFLFIFSTVLAIEVPEDAFATRLYFLIVLGFIAGFSERFARDALDSAEKSVATGGVGQGTIKAD